MSTCVCVLSNSGERLMPTFRLGKVRHLLKDGKAKIVKHHPFTIQLLYKALMPSVMFAIYIDGIYYANRGMYVDDATTINCEYSLNEEVLSHYDPNFVKGL